MIIWAYIVRFLFCGIPALAVAVIPYYFEPEVGSVLFVIAFAFGWVITKPKPERGESMTPGRSADNIDVNYKRPYRRE